MPVLKCSNGKYRIGTGPCVYKSKASAEKAYAGYRARKARGEAVKKVIVLVCICVECGWITHQSEPCSTIKCDACGGRMKQKPQVIKGKEAMSKFDLNIINTNAWKNLHSLSVIMRRTFNYRLSLAREWRGYYLQAMSEKKPDARVWAWYKFESKYMKSESGRWILRSPKAS